MGLIKQLGSPLPARRAAYRLRLAVAAASLHSPAQRARVRNS
jgi:hypothetical protein